MDDQPDDLDAVLAALREVSRRLDAMSEDEEEARDAWLERRKELRAVAARLRHGSTREALERELEDLRRRHQEILNLHLSTGHIGHAHAGGLDPISTIEYNRSVDESWDRATIERRITQIETQLIELDSEQA